MILTTRKSVSSYAPLLFLLGMLPFGLQNALVMLVLLLFGSLLFFYFGRSDRFLAYVLLGGFLARALIAIVDDKLAMLPYAWDDFYTAAVQIKDNVQNGYPAFTGIDKSIHLKSYSALSALLLFVFGEYEIPIRLLNCFLGVLVAERIYKICQFLNLGQRASKLSLLLTAFWPSFIIFNSLNMRDTLIIFLSVDLLVRFLRFNIQSRIINAFLMSIELFLLLVLRTQNIFVYVFVLVGYIMYTRVFEKRILYMIGLTILLIAGFAVFIFLFASQYFDGLLRYLNIEMQWRATGGSAYLVNQVYNSWFDVLKWAPIRFIYFCFGPFPWQVRNGFMLLAFFESATFFAFFLASFWLLFKEKSIAISAPIVLLLIFAVFGLAANSLIDSNYGTAIRHKMNYILSFFVFASVFIQKHRLRII